MPHALQYPPVGKWPDSADELVLAQKAVAGASPPPWSPPGEPLAAGGCFVCFPRGATGRGSPGDPSWAAAALVQRARVVASAVVRGEAQAAYEPGLLALREGPVLEAAVRALGHEPDVLLVDATGRDHPRRAGLALHLGAVLDIPTVGVTHRLLVAQGSWPEDRPGAMAAFRVAGEPAGYWVRTRRGARPLAIHAAWRTDPETAVQVVLAGVRGLRTPEPIRRARRLARTARAEDGG
jgi:deoxyribonuclease V